MTRAELAEAVYEIFEENCRTRDNDIEIWEKIAKADDEELWEFIEQRSQEESHENDAC